MNIFRFWQFHHTFLLIGLVFGLKMVFVNPPWQSNDEDRHFYNAYNLSEGHLGPQVQNNQCGFTLPTSLLRDIRTFQRVQFNDTSKISGDIYDDYTGKSLEPESAEFLETPTCKLVPVPYIPAAIMIKVGSIFQSSPIWIGWWARIGSLLAYLIITFIAIKKLPLFKPLLMLVALSPMALYQGASVTYDSLGFSLLFLFFALLLAYYFQEQKISLKQILILVAVAALQRLSKDGYFIVFFSLAFIPVSKFENKKLYWLGLLMLAIGIYLPPHLWTWYLNAQHLPPELLLQKDYLLDTSKNIQFNLKDPIHTVGLLLSNINVQGHLWIQGSIGTLGAMYMKIPFWLVIVHILSMIFVVIAEKKEQVLDSRFRLLTLGLVLLNCMAIVIMFYLAATPVGGYAIHGIQGRYFTPLLPFLFLFVFYIPKQILKADWLNKAVTVYVCITLLYLMNFLNTFYYTP